MWPFRKKLSYDDLQEQIRNLKRLVEERDLDWIDMRSRCKRLLDRTEKAARRIDSGEPVIESPEQPHNGGGGAETQAGRVLSPHQMEIQQKILRRRGGL